MRYWPARLPKRVFDLFAAMLLLLLGALPFIGIALCIRRDGGWTIFAHQRVGQSGRVFPCFKFPSTMHADAGSRLRELLATDPAQAR